MPKLDNLEEMDKFLETYNFPKINQEESEDLDRQITPSKIETVNNKATTKSPNKGPGPDVFQVDFTILRNGKHSEKINTSPSQTISKNSK